MKFLLLHGVNHNRFGERDPQPYGTAAMAELDTRLQALALELRVGVERLQTNSAKRTTRVALPDTVRNDTHGGWRPAGSAGLKTFLHGARRHQRQDHQRPAIRQRPPVLKPPNPGPARWRGPHIRAGSTAPLTRKSP